MSRESRQKALLAVLVLVLGGVLWVRVVDDGPRPRRARRAGDRVAALVDGSAEVVALRVAALERASAVYTPGRDPFSYGQAPAPEPAPQPERPPRRQRRRRQRPAPAAATQPARPRPPNVDVKFLGSFGRSDDRIAVFLDGSDIINARVGEVVKEKFIVDAIGYESADLAFVGFPDTPSQRLPAGG